MRGAGGPPLPGAEDGPQVAGNARHSWISATRRQDGRAPLACPRARVPGSGTSDTLAGPEGGAEGLQRAHPTPFLPTAPGTGGRMSKARYHQMGCSYAAPAFGSTSLRSVACPGTAGPPLRGPVALRAAQWKRMGLGGVAPGVSTPSQGPDSLVGRPGRAPDSGGGGGSEDGLTQNWRGRVFKQRGRDSPTHAALGRCNVAPFRPKWTALSIRIAPVTHQQAECSCPNWTVAPACAMVASTNA